MQNATAQTPRPAPSARALAAMLRDAADALERMEEEAQLQDATIEVLERENARLHARLAPPRPCNA